MTLHAALATLILITNVFLTIVASHKYEVERGIGTAMIGSCDKVKTWNTIIHVPLNVLSTVLLGASSYTMQCLWSVSHHKSVRIYPCVFILTPRAAARRPEKTSTVPMQRETGSMLACYQ